MPNLFKEYIEQKAEIKERMEKQAVHELIAAGTLKEDSSMQTMLANQLY